MCDLLYLLRPSQQTGSKPRCHSLTHGTREEVAARLTDLIAPWGHVTRSDHWMPQGFVHIREARLDQSARLIASHDHRAQLQRWWLTISQGANTPNWDIASTCSIGDRPGFLLVEAKAHRQELSAAETGKCLKTTANANSLRNHLRIGWCIEDASVALADDTALPWKLSRDSRYQMSNRFAWAWKLTELGYPVILVYLGFLNAKEMPEPFVEHDDWSMMVKEHSAPLFPSDVWQHAWTLNSQTFVPLIRTLEQPLCGCTETLGSETPVSVDV